MGRELAFAVDMTPMGKERHRAYIGDDGKLHTYPATRTVNAEAEIRAAFRRAYPRHAPHEGPVELYVVATIVPPMSWPKWKRALALLNLWRCTVKPDWDNIGKMTDALSKIAYHDDAQVFDGRVRKEYGDVPRLLVRMRLFDQPTRADFKVIEPSLSRLETPEAAS